MELPMPIKYDIGHIGLVCFVLYECEPVGGAVGRVWTGTWTWEKNVQESWRENVII